MGRRTVVLAASGLMLFGMAGPAQADTPPPHGHLLVLGVQYDTTGEPTGFRKCVDIAAGRALPLKAHHAHAHTGRAGEALFNAGHAVIPTAPYGPFADCAELEEIFGH